jgi:signal transduction histidine kinase
MNNLKYPVSPEVGLQFFGQITASISHEIKNCLAIMNENAGLLQDLVVLNQRGKPLDPTRIDRIAGQINGQVRRADSVVKNLNQFAHSTDNIEKSLNLAEALSLTIALNHRLSTNRGVDLHFTDSEDSCIVSISPFLFQYLMSRCLDHIIDVIGSGKRIDITLQRKEAHSVIAFMLDNCIDDLDLIDRFQKETGVLLEQINCNLSWNKDQTEFRLVF